MFELLKKILNGQNQFASGGLFLMLLGGVGVFLRSLPWHAWNWIVRQSTMTLTVKDDDQAYKWVKEWFLEQQFLKRVRRLDLDTTLRGAEAALVPAPGRHWFMRGGRPYWMWLWRSEDTKGYSQRRVESLMIETIGRNPQVLRQFVAEIVACNKKRQKSASYLYLYDDGWDNVMSYSPRRLESVLLKPGEKEHLLQDVERFRSSRERYRRLGVPYHRGYLFYGPPGTGKTSLISALAARFGMSVYVVNLSEMNDRTLKNAMNWVPEHSVILFEDIDCMNANTRRSEAGDDARTKTAPEEKSDAQLASKTGVSLSGLLNVLDGFSAPEGVLYAMTTNDIGSLDAALLRPGRIDYKLYLGEACESQKVELYRRFFPEASDQDARDFAQANWAETMAEFQGLLLALEQEYGTTEIVVERL